MTRSRNNDSVAIIRFVGLGMEGEESRGRREAGVLLRGDWSVQVLEGVKH